MRDDAGSKVPRRAGSAPARGHGTIKKNRPNLRSSSLNDACPHLGIDGDPVTNFAFPAPGNRCFQTSSPQTIPLHHQETFCLKSKHSACPIFRSSAGAAPSSRSPASRRWHRAPAIRAEQMDRLRQKLKIPSINGRRSTAVATAALAILVLIAALLFHRPLLSVIGATVTARGAETVPALAPSATTTTQPTTAIEATAALPSPSATLPSPIVVTRPRPTADARPSADPVTTASPSPAASRTATPTVTHTAVASPTTPAAPTATSELANCGPPAGWDTYIVSWGESLFLLSLRFNTTADELRQANCLASTRIYAGQSLFVPSR